MVETNFQHYQHKIKEIILNGDSLALTNDGELRSCRGLECGKCQFFIQCHEKRRNWLISEYKEPKPKLTPADHHLVNILKNGYIARDYNGDLYFYYEKPVKHSSSLQWSVSCWCCRLDHSDLFAEHDFLTFIKWSDSEPWSTEDLLKLEVEK